MGWAVRRPWHLHTGKTLGNPPPLIIQGPLSPGLLCYFMLRSTKAIPSSGLEDRICLLLQSKISRP